MSEIMFYAVSEMQNNVTGIFAATAVNGSRPSRGDVGSADRGVTTNLMYRCLPAINKKDDEKEPSQKCQFTYGTEVAA